MGIKTFVLSLLIISISLLIATVVFTPVKIVKQKTVPAVTFINSIMYDINTQEVTQLVKSKKAYHFNTKDELYDATIILKSQNNEDKKRLISDIISAKFIEITNNLLKFRGDVNYNRPTGTILQSQALNYDRITKNLIGNEKFTAFYNGNKLKGDSLFITKGKTIFKSNSNAPIKLDIIMNKKEKNETN
jgi:hypothetical protein